MSFKRETIMWFSSGKIQARKKTFSWESLSLSNFSHRFCAFQIRISKAAIAVLLYTSKVMLATSISVKKVRLLLRAARENFKLSCKSWRRKMMWLCIECRWDRIPSVGGGLLFAKCQHCEMEIHNFTPGEVFGWLSVDTDCPCTNTTPKRKEEEEGKYKYIC